MTNDELRAHVDAAGLSLTSFQERVATAVVGTVETAADERRRTNAVRNVKRWFRNGSHEVRPQQNYRDAVRLVLGHDPWAQPSVDDRLAALEGRVAQLLTTEEAKRLLAGLLESISAQASRGTGASTSPKP